MLSTWVYIAPFKETNDPLQIADKTKYLYNAMQKYAFYG